MKTGEKAEKLVMSGKVRKDVDTDKRTHFTVIGESGEHSVILDKTRQRWSCDCRYSALLDKECSHIKAAKMKV